MQRVTLIDNYDSFTFNLVHYLGELGAEVSVWRNDQITVKDALAAKRLTDRLMAEAYAENGRRFAGRAHEIEADARLVGGARPR